MIKMDISGIAIDNNNMPLVILKGNDTVLPIWIGMVEAQSILFALEGIVPPRPLTHDLLKSIIEQMGAKLERIVITAIHNNIYFARLQLSFHDDIIEIDSRPSDAIVLALRLSSPIYVSEHVLSTLIMPDCPIGDDEISKFKEDLKNLKPSDTN